MTIITSVLVLSPTLQLTLLSQACGALEPADPLEPQPMGSSYDASSSYRNFRSKGNMTSAATEVNTAGLLQYRGRSRRNIKRGIRVESRGRRREGTGEGLREGAV